ncbi:helix-turn-helix transcriptional regulator [Aerophototrophica crusticola]|uniref:Helix-turn-helix transcriptional regulator n=2 Tax=Aerophototrophica crusticola TaxID=1709002 RepID=A0A858R3G8_9PROT|nr:helix-turn-helix transcriptional regulator [Rhodospirillaceae bacterium B3]
MIVGAQVRAARGLLDITQEELAAMCGMTAQTVKDFERGLRKPQPRTIRDLQRALEENGIDFLNDNAGGIGVMLRRTEL